MAIINITEDGNYTFSGIKAGSPFTFYCSGSFGGATVNIQYSNSLPENASAIIKDSEDVDAIEVKALLAGSSGNGSIVNLIDPSANNAPLRLVQDGVEFDIYLATDAEGEIISTIGDIYNFLQTLPFRPHFTVSYLEDVDPDALAAVTSPELVMAGGNDGSFVDFTESGYSFTSPYSGVFYNFGAMNTVNFSVTSAGESTDIKIVANPV